MIAISFFTGSDSPVNTASAISRLLTKIRYPSAGTLSPSSKITKSHGTTSVESIDICIPSLSTFDFRLIIFLSDSMDFSALYSCTNQNIAFNKTIITIIIPSTNSPTLIEMPVAIIKIMIRGLVS